MDTCSKSLDEELLQAALAGDAAATEQAIHSGADPNAADRIGRTALMLATMRRHQHVLGMLLDAGADPNARSRVGPGAMSAAIALRSTEMARVLLEYGFDVHAKSP